MVVAVDRGCKGSQDGSAGLQARWDAYTATVRGARPEDVLGLLWRIGDGIRQGRGYHQFETRVALVDRTGLEAVAVQFGGVHRDLVMVEAKGERTPEVVDSIRGAMPGHRCTRADSAADFDEVGAWDRTVALMQRVKRQFRLRGERRGDWDFPEDGRTQYLGAPSSAVRARLYEKGKHPDFRWLKRPDWVRVECQVRPEGTAREVYAAASAVEVWGASPWTRALAASVLELELQPLPAYTARRQNGRDRALAWMCAQYGSHLVGLRDDLGDWHAVGAKLGEIIQKANDQRRRRS